MDRQLAGIINQALALSHETRAILVSRLWYSLDRDHRLPPHEMETVLTAYQRDREIEDGAERALTLEEVLSELEKDLDEADLSQRSLCDRLVPSTASS